jgi:hypothetical protein
MSDLSTTSCCGNNKSDSGMNPMLMILMLLFLCGGDGGLFGCGDNNNSCGCGGGNGLDGMLPILLLLFLGGGSCFC